MSFGDKRHALPDRFRSGVLVSTPLDGGPVVFRDTFQCCHCGYTAVWVPGSGTRRGYCARCDGIVCGESHCVATGCVCQERQLDLVEKGIPFELIHEGLVPVTVSVPVAPPRG